MTREEQGELAIRILAEISEILWPTGSDPDDQWEVETIEYVAGCVGDYEEEAGLLDATGARQDGSLYTDDETEG